MRVFKILNNQLQEYKISEEDEAENLIDGSSWIDISPVEFDSMKDKFNLDNSIHFVYDSCVITEKELARDYEVEIFLLQQTLLTIHSGIILLQVSNEGSTRFRNSVDIFLSILLEEINRIDKELEQVETNVRELTSLIFNPKNNASELKDVILSIGHNSELVFKFQRSLKNLTNQIRLIESESFDVSSFIINRTNVSLRVAASPVTQDRI